MTMVRGFFSNLLGQYPEHDNLEIVKKYVEGLKSHKYKAEPYFTDTDGEIYEYVVYLFNSDPGSEKYEYAVANLYSFIGKTYRAIVEKPVGIRELITANMKKDSYLKGGKYLRYACWIAVHSYILNTFLPKSALIELIPIDHPELSPRWNNYLFNMEDVPVSVRSLFVLDQNGNCELVTDVPVKDNIFNQNNNFNDFREVKEENLHPMDDNEEKVSDKDVKETDDYVKASAKDDKGKEIKAEIINTDKKEDFNTTNAQDVEFKEISVIEDSKEKDDYIMKMAEQIAANNSTSDNKRVSFTRNNNIKEYTFGQLKDAIIYNDPNYTAAGEAPTPFSSKMTEVATDNYMSSIIGSMPKYHVEKNPITGEPNDIDDDPVKDQYIHNNKGWEKIIPGLNAFTRLIHKAGYSVQYQQAINYPGLIYTEIIDQKMNDGYGGIHKIVLIDPGLIYGDTIRMILLERNDCDITKEIYLSKSQPDLVIKALQTGLDKDDKKKINEALPRSIYDVINRVDMRGLNGKCRNFFEWRSLVTNISKVLVNMPICRFRIMDVESKDKFKLICDEKVLSSFYTNIFTEESHIKYATMKLWVDFDKEKYEKYYIVGSMNNSQIDFDPYSIDPTKKHDKEDKSQKNKKSMASEDRTDMK